MNLLHFFGFTCFFLRKQLNFGQIKTLLHAVIIIIFLVKLPAVIISTKINKTGICFENGKEIDFVIGPTLCT